MNKILIIMDAARKDSIDRVIGENRFFKQLLDDGARSHNNAFSHAPMTNHSVSTLLSGKLPLERDDPIKIGEGKSLQEKLQGKGYSTAFFHSNPYLSRMYGFDRGWNRFEDNTGMGKSHGVNQNLLKTKRFLRRLPFLGSVLSRIKNRTLLSLPYTPGDKINQQVKEWVESQNPANNFLYVHYMDPHYPYVPKEENLPDRFKNRKEAYDFCKRIERTGANEEQRRVLEQLYYEKIKETEEFIEELLTFLDEQGWMDEEYQLVISSDHGEIFRSDALFHPKILDKELLHIPLIYYGPPANAFGELTCLQDIHHLLAEEDIEKREKVVAQIDKGRGMSDFGNYTGRNLENLVRAEIRLKDGQAMIDVEAGKKVSAYEDVKQKSPIEDIEF